jgi:hypothetical protein
VRKPPRFPRRLAESTANGNRPPKKTMGVTARVAFAA